MNVGYVGLGRMGRPMAEHLLKAGHTVMVRNRSRAAEEALASQGARVAASPAELVEAAEVVCTCLPDSAAVEAVYLGEAGLLSGEAAGRLLIDHSTVGPDLSRRLAVAASERGAAFLDAPVSGGPAGAAAGTLSIMVGGDQAAFERAEPVLKAYGGRIVHMGPSGAGSVTKLANQLLVGVHSASAAEAILLAASQGIDLRKMLEVIGQSFGASRMLERNGPLIVDRRFDPATSIDLLSKDLGLIDALARGMGGADGSGAVLALPLARRTRELFEAAQQAGLGDRDIAAMVLPLEREAGIEVKAPPAG